MKHVLNVPSIFKQYQHRGRVKDKRNGNVTFENINTFYFLLMLLVSAFVIYDMGY